MRKVNLEDKIFYYERNWFTLDGLWFLKAEEEVGWDTALKIDLAVWKHLLKIVIRRIQDYLKLKTNSLKSLVESLIFRWSCELWNYDIVKNEENEALIEITKCPYKSMLDRNPERRDKIPSICKKMCNPFYGAVIEELNPKIKLERSRFMGLGDKSCDFHFRLNES